MQETSEATATQTDLPSPAEAAEAPATPAEGAPEPVTAPETAEEPAPSVEEPEKPYATIKGQPLEDAYGVLDHEEMKPHLERRDRRVDETIRQEYQGQFDEAKKGLEATHAHKTLAGIYGNILQKLQDSDIEGATRLIDRLDTAIEPYKETHAEGLKSEGKMTASRELLGAFHGSLGRREQEQFEDFCTTRRNASWKDIIDHYVELRGVSTKKPLQEKVTSLETQLEEAKRRIREGGGAPDLTPKGGGGGSDEKLLLDPNTPIATITEIRTRQKAAGK